MPDVDTIAAHIADLSLAGLRAITADKPPRSVSRRFRLADRQRRNNARK